MKALSPLIIVLAWCAPALAMADGSDPATTPPADNRIKVLSYDESDVYTINTKYGYQTNIVFGNDEEVQTISMGDHSLWQIVPNGHRMFIRPMEEDVTTNMTVITNKRSYQFDLKAVSEKAANNIYVAKFVYPEDTKKKPSAVMLGAPAGSLSAAAANSTITAMMSQPPLVTGPPLQPPANANFNYTYAGPDELAPLQVYDDGKSTYVRYRELHQPLPAAYVVDASGKQKPLAVYSRGSVLVVDGVVGEMALKSVSGSVTIYNEMLNPK